MKPLFLFIASAIILAALAIAFPDMLFNPGPLLKGHQSLKRECLACHKPFSGAGSLQCISCHKQGDIGLKNVAGNLLPAKSKKVLFHTEVAASSCIDCHTDHKGESAKKAIKQFKHEQLAPSKRSNCISCHQSQKPDDPLHRSAFGSCQECHTTTAWKPATFDHQKLSALSGKACISCHKREQPNDELHRLSQASCATCHSTTAWKPATFDHSKYFRLDGDHQASCKTCHTDPANYKKYTCYNCHEHSEAAMAREHQKEGIYNYQNCIKCHSSGNREGGEHGERGGEERLEGRRGGDDDD